MVARRRARRRLLRPRRGQAERAAGRGGVHERHGRRALPARGDRGPRGARAAASSSPPIARPSCAPSAPGRRSTSSSSTGTPRSGSSRSAPTTPRPSGCAGSASWPSAPTRRAVSGRPGAVHLNFALREPLVLDDAAARARRRRAPARARAAPRRRRARDRPRPRRARGDRRRAPRARATTSARPLAAAARRARHAAAGRPALRARAAARAAVAHYDELLRDARLRGRPSPADRHPHRRPADLQAAAPVAGGRSTPRQVAFDPEAAWQDPAAVVSEVLDADPAAWARCDRPTRRARVAWLDAWRAADAARRRQRIAAALGDEHQRAAPSRARWRALPARGRPSSPPPRCRCATSRASGRCATRRRASSPTAAPTASTAPSPRPSAPRPRGARVVVHLGDVALAHDLGALLSAVRLELRAHGRARRQRRRRDLRLPPGRHADRCLRGARRHPDRPGRRARRRALRPAPTSASTTSPRSARPPVRCCTSAPTALRTWPCIVACMRPSPSGSPASFGRP